MRKFQAFAVALSVETVLFCLVVEVQVMKVIFLLRERCL